MGINRSEQSIKSGKDEKRKRIRIPCETSIHDEICRYRKQRGESERQSVRKETSGEKKKNSDRGHRKHHDSEGIPDRIHTEYETGHILKDIKKGPETEECPSRFRPKKRQIKKRSFGCRIDHPGITSLIKLEMQPIGKVNAPKKKPDTQNTKQSQNQLPTPSIPFRMLFHTNYGTP